MRIPYIDALRGLAIFLVVSGHVLCFSFETGNKLASMLTELDLPLFFMISGFFTSKILERSLWTTVKEKFLALVVPAALMLGVYCYLFEFNYGSSFVMMYKQGYWFTFALFEFFVFFTVVEKILARLKMSMRGVCVVHGVMGLGALYLYSFLKRYISFECDPLGVFHMQQYMFFVSGAILCKLRNRVKTEEGERGVAEAGAFGINSNVLSLTLGGGGHTFSTFARGLHCFG